MFSLVGTLQFLHQERMVQRQFDLHRNQCRKQRKAWQWARRRWWAVCRKMADWNRIVRKFPFIDGKSSLLASKMNAKTKINIFSILIPFESAKKTEIGQTFCHRFSLLLKKEFAWILNRVWEKGNTKGQVWVINETHIREGPLRPILPFGNGPFRSQKNIWEGQTFAVVRGSEPQIFA